MGRQIFREKSLERMKTPDQLDAYMKVTGSGMWMMLAAILALLAGACVWGLFGSLETSIQAAASAKDGVLYCYIAENKEVQGGVSPGMTVRAGGGEYPVRAVSDTPVKAEGVMDDYAMHLSGISGDGWVYVADRKSVV